MPEWDDRLRFHVRCGTLVKLSSNSRSAKRLRAFDEFNNGVVMTNRNLFDDELFEVKITIVSNQNVIHILVYDFTSLVINWFSDSH